MAPNSRNYILVCLLSFASRCSALFQITDKESNLLRCCQAVGVPSDCQSLCSYQFDQMNLICLADKCHNFLQHWMWCAADGGQKSNICCDSNGVNPSCDQFCAGTSPDVNDLLDNLQYLPCINGAPTILACHKSQPGLGNWVRQWDAQPAWTRTQPSGKSTRRLGFLQRMFGAGCSKPVDAFN